MTDKPSDSDRLAALQGKLRTILNEWVRDTGEPLGAGVIALRAIRQAYLDSLIVQEWPKGRTE